MWRFLNSIPRALRQYIHNPRPSAGSICNVDEEVSDQEVGGVQGERQRDCVSGRPRHSPGVTEEGHGPGRLCGLVASVLREKTTRTEESSCNEEHRSYTGSNGGQWWRSCQRDFWRLLHGSNRALEAISLGSAMAWSGSENSPQHRQKFRLFYRVLFAVQCREAASTTVRSIKDDVSSPVDMVRGQIQGSSCETPLTSDQDPAGGNKESLAQSAEVQETLKSVLEEYQSLCSEQTACSESVLGLHAYEQGDLDEAIKRLQSACALGNSSACFNLGLCYEMGSGVVQDLAKAKKYYKHAAELGHSSALYNLGLMFLNQEAAGQQGGAQCCGGCKDVAVDLLERAAEAGLAEAQTYMGVHYMEEQHDAEKAVQFFSAAADQNDPEAQYFLAMCYERGLGVEQNECRAAHLYSQSAGAGHHMALYNLGVFNENGLGGLPENLATATELYTKAAHLGNELAQGRLHELKAYTQHDTFQANMNTFQHLYQLYNGTATSPRDHHSLSPSASSPNLSMGDWNWNLSDHAQEDLLHHSLFDPGGGGEKMGRKEKKSSSLSSSSQDDGGVEDWGRGVDSQKSMYFDDIVQSEKGGLSGSFLLHRSHTSPDLAMVACHS